MGDCLRVGAQSRYSQLSLLSLQVSKSSTAFWPGLRRGAFTCVGWQVTPSSCRTGISPTALTFKPLLTGDVGGYLGLLIGGSCLTLIEVIDLVCYNSLMRCCRRGWRWSCSDFTCCQFNFLSCTYFYTSSHEKCRVLCLASTLCS